MTFTLPTSIILLAGRQLKAKDKDAALEWLKNDLEIVYEAAKGFKLRGFFLISETKRNK